MQNAVSLLCYKRYRGKNCKNRKNCHDNLLKKYSVAILCCFYTTKKIKC